jgi:Family of unknown function (DUF6065)
LPGRYRSRPNLKDHYEQWQFARTAFNSDLKRSGTRARDKKWQKLYYRGLNPDGTPNDVKDHHTRVRLKPFVKTIPYSRRGD